MTVYRRKDNNDIWVYDFWRQGRRYRGECRHPETGLPARNKTEAREAEKLAQGAAIRGGAASRSIVRGGDFTLAMAQAQLLKRVIDRRRKPTHVDNIRLWGDEALAFFGAETAFADLTQRQLDDYAAHLAAGTVRKWLGGTRRPTADDVRNADLWRDTGRRRSPRQVNNYLKHFRKLLGIADKTKDPITRQPVLHQDPPLQIELERVPRRKPRPMPDDELAKRTVKLPPWQRDVVELSRLFGLRASECLRLEIRHIDRDARAIFFRGEETKSGHDEHAHGGDPGWQLLQRLRLQAIKRKTTFLVTWPATWNGTAWFRTWLAGKPVPAEAWQPLKKLGGSWRRSAALAGVEDPHRFHDVRARYITEVAKTNKAAARGAARHQDPATTELYIGVADDEVRQAVAAAISRSRPTAAPARRRMRSVK